MGIGEVGELLRRSTVHIRSASRQGNREGSGVIADHEGTIITNAHVVGSGDHLVELWDGRAVRAKVAAKDERRDLAKLKLSENGLPPLSFRESALRPGELVIAVGNPLGFTGALTTGVVHATGPVSSLGRRAWVQAAIRLAPGNSGGPLADSAGQLAGINTMVVSGVALAIPSFAVRDFLRNGAIPKLGVALRPVSLGGQRLGLLVLGIDRASLAEYASLLIGDILVGANARAFESPGDLADSISEARGGILRLQFLRGDARPEREVAISVANRGRQEAA